jgi:hypothetical protein
MLGFIPFFGCYAARDDASDEEEELESSEEEYDEDKREVVIKDSAIKHEKSNCSIF